MPVFFVKHVTTYDYTRPVEFGEHRLMFRPRDSFDQRLIAASLAVEPEASRVRWLHDVFGNCVALVQPSRAATRLRFETYIELDHTRLRPSTSRRRSRRLPIPSATTGKNWRTCGAPSGGTRRIPAMTSVAGPAASCSPAATR